MNKMMRFLPYHYYYVINMNQHQKSVMTFHKQMGLNVPKYPTTGGTNLRMTRAKLILEEAFELIEALGMDVKLSSDGRSVTRNNCYITPSNAEKIDLVSLCKELADVRVVTTGTELMLGININPIQTLVDNNNLDKFGPGSYINKDGKLVKPPNHPNPNVEIYRLLKSLGYNDPDYEKAL